MIKLKYVIGLFFVGLFVGGFCVRILGPTKIKTVVEVKTEYKTDTKIVHDQVFVTKTEKKITKKDGTIEDTIVTVDKSKIDNKEFETDKTTDKTVLKEIDNPKNLSLGIVYKESFANINPNDLLPTYNNVGVVAVYQTQILSTFILGGFFLDSTAIVGVGFTF